MPLDAVGGRVGRRESVVVATSGFLISIAAVSFVLHKNPSGGLTGTLCF